MIDWPQPGPLFNPFTDAPSAPVPLPQALTEIFAGPYGLTAFLPLVPVVLLLARRSRPAALIVAGLLWLLPTLQLQTTAMLFGGLAVATAWLLLLRRLRQGGLLGERPMIALVWLGLHALIFPLWWTAKQAWYPAPMAALHGVGFAYFLFRYIDWGVHWARTPHDPIRPVPTLCWLLYPPCMRLGPVMRRTEFLTRYDAWNLKTSPRFRAGLQRLGLFLLGGAGILILAHNVPPTTEAENFFSHPDKYKTGELLRTFYFLPVIVYLALWTYNELAATLSYWVGIPVDNNFNWLPRATSTRDFWRRWHITVGAWLRDHIYIPLGGNRTFPPLNYVLVFGYCGIWHGASWSFVAWGVLQGLALSVERYWDQACRHFGWTDRNRNPLWTAVAWLLTMHFQLVAIVVFIDFEHCGVRLLRELLLRLTSGGASA